MLNIYIGFDSREPASFAVCRKSIEDNSHNDIGIRGLVLRDLRDRGFYKREHVKRNSQLYDVISDAPMSTEFAITRFLVPQLNSFQNWAIFMDSDMMFRVNPLNIFNEIENQPNKALYCVKHKHNPVNTVKMDNQQQTLYHRKNWSSFMLFRCDHPSHRKIAPLINAVPGRDLHRFCWLEDDEIGDLTPDWNYLVGHTVLPEGVQPKVIHWTDGSPEFPSYENVEYADEWRKTLIKWAL